MNMYDQIESYLNKELTKEEELVFEAALRTDQDLQLEVDRHRDVLSRLEVVRLREKIRRQLVQVPSNDAGAARRFRTTAAAAATLLGLFLIVVYWFPDRPAHSFPPFPANPPAYPDTLPKAPTANKSAIPGKNRPDKPRPEIKQETYALYLETAQSLREINYHYLSGLEKADAQIEERLNEIIRLMRNDGAEKAIPNLEEILTIQGLEPGYREDTEWLLSIALLKTNPKKSREALNKIAREQAHSRRVEAIRLRSKLE